MPFSDPIADGPVNQRAAARALAAGTTLSGILQLVARARATELGVPIVLFTYFNPIHARGVERFAEQAAASGVDGVLCVDLPPEEAERGAGAGPRASTASTPSSCWRRPARASGCKRVARGLERLRLLRLAHRRHRRARRACRAELRARGAARCGAGSTLPLAVGFGISTPAQVAAVGEVADGVVVGSALVRLVEENAAATPSCRRCSRSGCASSPRPSAAAPSAGGPERA